VTRCRSRTTETCSHPSGNAAPALRPPAPSCRVTRRAQLFRPDRRHAGTRHGPAAGAAERLTPSAWAESRSGARRQRAWEQSRAAASGRAAMKIVECVVHVAVEHAELPRQGGWPEPRRELAAQLDSGRIYPRDVPDLGCGAPPRPRLLRAASQPGAGHEPLPSQPSSNPRHASSVYPMADLVRTIRLSFATLPWSREPRVSEIVHPWAMSGRTAQRG
jgi:hypothetical protein